MATVLPGYTWSSSLARFRNTATGQFVAKSRITALLNTNVNSAEQRLGEIVTAMHEGTIAPGAGQLLMRDEMRRLSLQNAALGKGGIERLDFRDYGRVGRQLRDTYQRISNLARDMEDGKVSIAQALNRVQGYVGEARQQFYASQRDALRETGRVYQERRRLNPAEHCRDCIRWASMSWQPLGTLPPPGSESACGTHCRCNLETREVTPEMTQERQRVNLERMMAQ